MKGLELTILTPEDLESRHDKLKNTKMDLLINEAVENGYSIGCLSYTGLGKDSGDDWGLNVKNAVASYFRGQSYKIGGFVDLSEVIVDKLYFSFKTKNCVQIAHSPSGSDSDGFIFNNG